tara:strand:+ start:613 stop:1272 length:660 start_codon:yes stop_codon:yes gene_type:complete
MSLTNKTVADTYKDLLTVNSAGNDNQGLESTTKTVIDGEGISSALKLGTTSLEFTGPVTGTTATFSGNVQAGGFVVETDSSSGTTAPIMTVNSQGAALTNITQMTMVTTQGTSVPAFTTNTSGSIILNSDLQTKGALTFSQSGHDDLTLSAANADFGKSGDKGKMKFEDSKVSMNKGTKELFTAKDNGTTRMQTVSSLPSTDVQQGDIVNQNGTLFVDA